jgi:hypothetical protein
MSCILYEFKKALCGNDGKVSKSDKLYSIQTGSNPKCYRRIMGGTAVPIYIIDVDPRKISGQSSMASIFGGKNRQ